MSLVIGHNSMNGSFLARMEIESLKAKLSKANKEAQEWKEKAKMLERIITSIEGISPDELRVLYKMDRDVTPKGR